jgi:hypothetical protein
MDGRAARVMANEIPEYCDFDCPHADFPPAVTAGVCRTMGAVWCKKLEETVHKHTLCAWRKRQGKEKAGGPGAAGRRRKRGGG